MKLFKWHSIVFCCPRCARESDYALEIIGGPERGSIFSPVYWCEHCRTTARVRDPWMFGAVFGPFMAVFGVFAYQAVPEPWGWLARGAISGIACLLVGWTVSRILTKHLVDWEPVANSRVLRRIE